MILVTGAAGKTARAVLRPQIEVMPHHWNKLRVEEALLASGLSFTILRPAAYMQEAFWDWKRAREGEDLDRAA